MINQLKPTAWLAEWDGNRATTVHPITMREWKYKLGRKITPLYVLEPSEPNPVNCPHGVAMDVFCEKCEPRSQPVIASELLPCPLCQSKNVQLGLYWAGERKLAEGAAARCGDCGCRATKVAWQSRARSGVQSEQQDVLDWVETWVSNPVGAYSVHALDGLFRMTRDKIEALRASRLSSADRGTIEINPYANEPPYSLPSTDKE